MKILKIILILILLFSMSVFGQPTTLENTLTHEPLEIADWYYEPGDSMNWNPDYKYWDCENNPVVYQNKPDTLLGWFKSLTLDEKIELYRWWKSDNVTLCDDDIFPKLIIKYD